MVTPGSVTNQPFHMLRHPAIFHRNHIGVVACHQVSPRGLAASAVRGIGVRGDAPGGVTPEVYSGWQRDWTGPSSACRGMAEKNSLVEASRKLVVSAIRGRHGGPSSQKVRPGCPSQLLLGPVLGIDYTRGRGLEVQAVYLLLFGGASWIRTSDLSIIRPIRLIYRSPRESELVYVFAGRWLVLS